MIRCLCTVLYLAQSLMDILRCLTDGLCKQLIRHKMRAGTGCKKSAVLYKTHCTEIDLTVSLDGIFYRASGFRKCRRIQYHNKAKKAEQEAQDQKNLLDGKVKELEKELDELLK